MRGLQCGSTLRAAARLGGGGGRRAFAAAAAAPPPRPRILAAAAAANYSDDAAAAAAPMGTHPVIYHPDFRISPIPEGHRFPMPKDALLYDRLTALGLAGRTFTPTPPDVATLCLAHDPAYVDAFLTGTLDAAAMRRIGLPWSEALVRRTLIGVGSAVLAARVAAQLGVAVMCNGGTHHAHAGRGAGWCIFNDQAVAARAAQRDAGVATAMFVDLDTHLGDGTAAIFRDDPSVFTLSMHCKDQSFPAQLERSDLDIALPAGTGDAEYLEALRATLPRLLADVRPDLVLYNAGVDVAAGDSLGKLALSDAGIAARDDFVMGTCAAAGVPVAAAIGGGYSPDHSVLVERHVLLHRAAAKHWPTFAAAAERRRRQQQQQQPSSRVATETTV